jgi:hypothetical protein
MDGLEEPTSGEIAIDNIVGEAHRGASFTCSRASEPGAAAFTQHLEGDVEHWDHKDPDGAPGDHPSDTSVPTSWRLISAAPCATTSG